ncbi:MAG: prolipoprotein diacylglyceryl transferase [Bacilli bacterium]|jgi:phosphatidylglycerol:prolipoprotein diacylglycerol transferase|nr:prolipoprotein diacylglyceryl transferase [Bacilli bacterium]
MNNVILDLGFAQITYYSILILLGVFLGGILVIREANKFKINKDFIANLIFWLVIIGVVGARAYYVAFNWDYYQVNVTEIFKVWEGGLAIHGGIVFAFIFLIIYTFKYKVNLARITDILVVGLILGQAIGRWGNFFNQEAYGQMVSRDFLVNLHLPTFIIEGMNIYGNYYHPTFLYESIWCFLGFIALLIVRRYRYLKIGQLTGAYLIWYSIGRFFIEGLRLDSLMLGDYRVAQLVSVGLLLIGVILVVERGKGSRFENLYLEKEQANEVKF